MMSEDPKRVKHSVMSSFLKKHNYIIITVNPILMLVFSVKFLVIGISNEKNIKQDLRLYEGIFIYPILFVYKSV